MKVSSGIGFGGTIEKMSRGIGVAMVGAGVGTAVDDVGAEVVVIVVGVGDVDGGKIVEGCDVVSGACEVVSAVDVVLIIEVVSSGEFVDVVVGAPGTDGDVGGTDVVVGEPGTDGDVGGIDVVENSGSREETTIAVGAGDADPEGTREVSGGTVGGSCVEGVEVNTLEGRGTRVPTPPV